MWLIPVASKLMGELLGKHLLLLGPCIVGRPRAFSRVWKALDKPKEDQTTDTLLTQGDLSLERHI